MWPLGRMWPSNKYYTYTNINITLPAKKTQVHLKSNRHHLQKYIGVCLSASVTKKISKTARLSNHLFTEVFSVSNPAWLCRPVFVETRRLQRIFNK